MEQVSRIDNTGNRESLEITIQPEHLHRERRNLTFQLNSEEHGDIVICFENMQKSLADLFDILYYSNGAVLSREVLSQQLGIDPPMVHSAVSLLRSWLDIANDKLRENNIPALVTVETFIRQGYSLKFWRRGKTELIELL